MNGWRTRRSILQFGAAVILALGLSFAQPVPVEGQRFREDTAHVEMGDAHTAAAVAEPPMPPPAERVTWWVELGRTGPVPHAAELIALARGDPHAVSAALRFRSGTLIHARRPTAA